MNFASDTRVASVAKQLLELGINEPTVVSSALSKLFDAGRFPRKQQTSPSKDDVLVRLFPFNSFLNSMFCEDLAPVTKVLVSETACTGVFVGNSSPIVTST